MDDADRHVLGRFCARVQELMGTRFLRDSISNGVKYNLSWNQGVVTQKRQGPDEEAIKAFLLTLRFFVQDNEQISIHNMAQRINNSDTRQDLKDHFAQERNRLNTYLDSSSPVEVIFDGYPLTCREILLTFLYGMYAHNADGYTKMLKRWQDCGIFVLLRSEFDNTVLALLLGALNRLRVIGCEILEIA